jgi:hypothetical protein
MKKTLLGLILGMTFSTSVLAQIDSPMTPPEKDFGDLFQRAAASRFVVIGTVIKNDGIGKRMTPELLKKMNDDIGVGFGGILYTISVESTVCRQTDFKANQTSPEAPHTLYMFQPSDEPMNVAGNWREIILSGQRYLLFFVPISLEVRKKWSEIYQLDPDPKQQEYFHGEELTRGVVPLPAGQAVLDRITPLCQALRPATLKDKLAALKNLKANSSDPIIKEEASAAETALQTPK